jgi:hypothetical protein
LLPPNITPQLLNKKDKSVSIDKTIVHFFIDYLIWFAINCQFRIKSMTRPEKSLHILVKNPDSNLHFLVSPEIALHLITGRSGSGQC